MQLENAMSIRTVIVITVGALLIACSTPNHLPVDAHYAF